MENEIFRLKASDSVNWGFCLFGTVSVALAYALAHTFLSFLAPFLYLIAGGFGASALLSPLFFQYRETVLTSTGIQTTQGILSQKKQYMDIKDIRKVTLVYLEKGQKKTDLVEDIDLAQKPDIKLEELQFFHAKKGETVTFHAYNFENDPFKEFINQFKIAYQVSLGTLPKEMMSIAKTAMQNEENEQTNHETEVEGNQISPAIQKTEDYLQEDRQLLHELKDAMNEAYQSIYELHNLVIVREGDELRLHKPDVAFFYTKDESIYQFYLKDKYRAEVDAEEIQVGENLIGTSLYNIGIVEARIKVYEEIMAQLKRTQAKYLQRAKLQSLADKISLLQQRNLQNSEDKDELTFDSSMIIELAKLTDKLKTADLALYAETLIQHANLLKDNDSNADTTLLQDLNDKIQ